MDKKSPDEGISLTFTITNLWKKNGLIVGSLTAIS